MTHAWDAGTYLRFAGERTQPALDLVARIDLPAPKHIVDLGCGPGNSTAILKARWPEAEVTGLDSDADMLATACRDHPGIEFGPADIAQWRPEAQYDLVFSNAALQWVGDHDRLLPWLFDAVAPGGVLAAQMPRNHDFETHALMHRVAAEGPWAERLAGARAPSPVRPPEFYYDCLAARAARFIIWETNYIQVMDGPDAIVAWLMGTGLRPFLARLMPEEAPLFLDRYKALLAEVFSPRADGKILLPYPRLFFIASRG